MPPTTRVQQREHTRDRLLQAAIACLIEEGYAATTDQRVQERAGVSRGALLHHFPRKSELLVAAVHHLADQQLLQLHGLIDPDDASPEGLRVGVAAIGQAMSGPAFLAAMELWTAARTNPELREALLPAERRLGRGLRALMAVHLTTREDHDELDLLLVLLRGTAVTRVVQSDAARTDRMMAAWIDRAIRRRCCKMPEA